VEATVHNGSTLFTGVMLVVGKQRLEKISLMISWNTSICIAKPFLTQIFNIIWIILIKAKRKGQYN
jgi:hypothetical protein